MQTIPHAVFINQLGKHTRPKIKTSKRQEKMVHKRIQMIIN